MANGAAPIRSSLAVHQITTTAWAAAQLYRNHRFGNVSQEAAVLWQPWWFDRGFLPRLPLMGVG